MRSTRFTLIPRHWPGFAITLLVSIAVNAARANDDWPQFRVPNSSGISTTDQPLPIHFSQTQNVALQQAVGDGVGGAVVAAGRVFVSEMTAANTVSLFAIDLESGTKLSAKGKNRLQIVVED